VWSGHSVEGYYDTRWVKKFWSTQAKMGGIVQKTAWHWGCDSRVVNDPLGKPGRTPLYVGLPSKWGSVDGDRRWALETERLSPGELCKGSLERGLFTGNSDSYVRRQEGFGNGASLSL
jgi:hypothetical protein